MKQALFGQQVPGLTLDGAPVRAGVFNEHEVRASAGLMLALGSVAFCYAYFAKVYAPIQTVTAFFFVEFLVRVVVGLDRSPLGLAARWLTRRQPPLWVSARPKRFAWSLGLVMALAMTVITNLGIRGGLPLTICLICLTLMWLETALGVCVGCEIHGLMLRRGWLVHGAEVEICSHGACAADPGRDARP